MKVEVMAKAKAMAEVTVVKRAKTMWRQRLWLRK
jgi:hypothetical protein